MIRAVLRFLFSYAYINIYAEILYFYVYTILYLVSIRWTCKWTTVHCHASSISVLGTVKHNFCKVAKFFTSAVCNNPKKVNGLSKQWRHREYTHRFIKDIERTNGYINRKQVSHTSLACGESLCQQNKQPGSSRTLNFILVICGEILNDGSIMRWGLYLKTCYAQWWIGIYSIWLQASVSIGCVLTNGYKIGWGYFDWTMKWK